ncbi:MAG: hydroxymethylglutaryl-CoA lyase [Bacteroidetes bacterium]|nr:MAG: hydroxymethylglutaryl-CoA lyase [Bacteroidota bacterium]
MIKIIESPREGMQGVESLIPTSSKVRFINNLLKVGFDTVEIGSIVNPKVVPQMADTLDLIRELNFFNSDSERMVLVMSRRGAEQVAPMEEVTALSCPFSFTPSFLEKNVRSTVYEVFGTTAEVVDLCGKYEKKAVIYISYAYGNPYGDPWSLDLLLDWIGKLRDIGAQVIPLSNVSVEIDAAMIETVFTSIISEYPDLEFGLHLHHGEGDWSSKVDAAYRTGCRRFDTVINGFGGCPKSGHELMGNLATQDLVRFLHEKQIPNPLEPELLKDSIMIANEIYQ